MKPLRGYWRELLDTKDCCTLLAEAICTARVGQAEHTKTGTQPLFPPVTLQCSVLTKLNIAPAGKRGNLQHPSTLMTEQTMNVDLELQGNIYFKNVLFFF